MVVLKRLLHIIDTTSERSAIFAWLVVPLYVVMMYEVVARYGFDSPTIWANDLSRLIFGVYFVIGGGYTLLHEGHVRMDLLFRRLSPRKEAILDLITSALLFLPFVVILLIAGTEICWLATIRHQTTGQIWNVPIWPTRWGLVVGAALLFLQGIVRFIRDLHCAITGRRSL